MSNRTREGSDSSASDAFEHVRLARHPERPYTQDIIDKLFGDFVELRGDRRFADDPAMIGGFAVYRGVPVAVIGQQKGRDTRERKLRNFGMPKPEGYRKALRIMKMAEKFGRPVFTFIDTPGAYPGIDAEERGQAEAIAFNLREMAKLRVPVIVTILGEGGSGGALGLGVGDSVLMLENAVYSVISPEGCAAILWKDAAQSADAVQFKQLAKRAASCLKLTAKDLYRLNLIDKIVREPPGGAHTDHTEAANLLDVDLSQSLNDVAAIKQEDRTARRYARLRDLGRWKLNS